MYMWKKPSSCEYKIIMECVCKKERKIPKIEKNYLVN